MTREKEVEIISEKHGTASLVYGKLHNDTLKGLLKHYQKGFVAGVKWADEHPKSPWISVKDDLPYKHKELLNPDDKSVIFRKIETDEIITDNIIILKKIAKEYPGKTIEDIIQLIEAKN